MMLGQADLLERAGETKAVHQAEQEGHRGGPAPGERVPPTQRFDRREHDRQRDRGFYRTAAQRQQPQSAAGQRQAVREREGRDGPDQLAVEAHQEQQADHEEQMVDAAQDVLDTEHRVGGDDLAASACIVRTAEQLRLGLGLRDGVDPSLAVQPGDPQQRGGVTFAHAVDADLAAQAAGTTESLGFAHAGLRPAGRELFLDRGGAGRQPGPDELAMGQFAHVELGHREFMRGGGGGAQDAGQYCQGAQKTPQAVHQAAHRVCSAATRSV